MAGMAANKLISATKKVISVTTKVILATEEVFTATFKSRVKNSTQISVAITEKLIPFHMSLNSSILENWTLKNVYL